MKKVILGLLIIIGLLFGYYMTTIPEPDRCSICDDLSRHAPCIVNLSTGEKMELDIYEPHPFRVGEIADEQPGGYFSFIRGAGIEGYKIAAERIVITVPVATERVDQQFFCKTCRERLNSIDSGGYIIVDLIQPDEPNIYPIKKDISMSVRCYSISVQDAPEKEIYEITITGNLFQ